MTKPKKTKKAPLTRGRIAKTIHPKAKAFSASHAVDRELYRYDIQGSIAHARMLQTIGLIDSKERDAIVKGLQRIESEIKKGQFEFDDALEDIHMHIEARLTERIGEAGGKLHTGRSRNDQVVLDLRMYCRDACSELIAMLNELQLILLEQAKKHIHILMPGYTHLQQAQVIRASHHFLAYMNMFERDRQRLQEIKKRTDIMPLGSGALAGTGLENDRHFLAKELGFSPRFRK